jgi:hypothetical protein
LAARGIKHTFIRPHSPRQNGKSRTVQPHPAKPNGPTTSPSPPTLLGPTPLPPGWTTTTLNADTPHSHANHRSAH